MITKDRHTVIVHSEEEGLLMHLQLLNLDSPTRIIVSIDIEKTFDSVDWQYMLRVLEKMGFGLVFSKCIS